MQYFKNVVCPECGIRTLLDGNDHDCQFSKNIRDSSDAQDSLIQTSVGMILSVSEVVEQSFRILYPDKPVNNLAPSFMCNGDRSIEDALRRARRMMTSE
ncbi:hypothetical protein Pla110_44110 [Polystyrenella longa]|uniref:Uncharacterized protein n=1 Tax=Polystyrenella longa TaxID=2528007 RepID=A0A518CTU3_9PLAN|nr:hypothetical protein Pla110_44110 [Polystyrenella longa]